MCNFKCQLIKFHGDSALWHNAVSNDATALFYATGVNVRTRLARSTIPRMKLIHEPIRVKSSIGIHGILSSRWRETRWISHNLEDACDELHHIAEEEKRSIKATIPRRDEPRFCPLGQCNSWKEARPVSNFKTHGANVTHMEFRPVPAVLSPPTQGAIAIRELKVTSTSYWTRSFGARKLLFQRNGVYISG